MTKNVTLRIYTSLYKNLIKLNVISAIRALIYMKCNMGVEMETTIHLLLTTQQLSRKGGGLLNDVRSIIPYKINNFNFMFILKINELDHRPKSKC